jgi:hypothetical protein
MEDRAGCYLYAFVALKIFFEGFLKKKPAVIFQQKFIAAKYIEK